MLIQKSNISTSLHSSKNSLGNHRLSFICTTKSETSRSMGAKGYKINIWGLINRYNKNHWATTEQNIDARFVFEQLEKLSFQIQKQTIVMIDNASIHKAKIIKQQLKFWEKRGLYIFYIPPYSPHLNIAETLWRKIKKEQIDPKDYLNKETLFYAVNRCLAQLGNSWKINFSNFNIN